MALLLQGYGWVAWILFIIWIIIKKISLDILETRFPSDEMTKEEFEKRKTIFEEEASKRRGLKYSKNISNTSSLKKDFYESV